MNRCVFGPRVTPTAAIALRGVRLRCRLSGMSQRTTVEQTYVNLERQAIEAVYTFPLPESAAVCGFEILTGDRVLTGEIDEIEKATETYDDAIADGHGAFLAEQHRPDVFSVRVGNLLPRQAVTVRLTYVCALDRADRAIRVAFPTTVAPRYVTTTATDPLDAQIDGDALNPPHVLAVPYGLTMEVDVDLGRPVRRITSPSHAITVTGADETRAVVALSAGVTEMDRDIVLALELEKEHEPVVQVARGTHGESYLAVTFVPEFDVDDLTDPDPSETIFVLDCSGSMQGASLAQATAALELCLRSLSPGDTFNVCRFGSTFELLATEPLHYSQPALERAIKYVRASGDLGGTELYGALKAVMSPGLPPGRRRQVVVLTDGQVSNEPALLDLARNLRPHNRIFSFGIGSAASSSLVKGLARTTGGAAEFIAGNERIDDKVLRTFGRLTSPMVEDVSIDWGGCDVQTLAELPPVFDGDVLTVFGRAPGKLPRAVTLSCKSPAGPKRWSVPVPAATDDAGVIATMWARRTIQSLEDVNRLTQNRYRTRKERSREEGTVIRLSKEFNLLSSLTAFVAVEHRPAGLRNEGTPALRRIPVALARDWGGLVFASRLRAAPAAGFAMMRAKAARLTDSDADELVELSGLAERAAGCAPTRAAMAPAPPDEEAAGVVWKDSRGPDHAGFLRAILALQQAEGWFGRDRARVDDPAEAALRRFGHDPAARLDAARRLVAPASGPTSDPDRVARTLLVLALLEDHYPAENALWRRAAQKALRYLQQALGRDGAEVNALVQAARAQRAPMS
jgi:Ca-activated chloride channel family protein